MRRLFPFLLLLLVATHAAAEENTAPLSESKRQLKQLQKDQSSRDQTATGSDLKGLMPSIAAPGGQALDLPPPPEMSSHPNGKDQPGAKSANWLLEGYDRLGAAAGKAGKGGRSLHEDGRAKVDEARETGSLSQSADKRDQNRADTEGRGDHPKSSQPPDPMEPFLKAWLAKSPVKDVILNARDDAKRLDNGSDLLGVELNPTREGSAPGPALLTTNTAGENTLGAKPENPYLQALNAPLPVTAPAVAPQTNVAPVAATGQGRIDAPVIDATTASPAKNNSFNGPPSQAKDDKKYFPQLKRF